MGEVLVSFLWGGSLWRELKYCWILSDGVFDEHVLGVSLSSSVLVRKEGER